MCHDMYCVTYYDVRVSDALMQTVSSIGTPNRIEERAHFMNVEFFVAGSSSHDKCLRNEGSPTLVRDTSCGVLEV